MVAWSRETFIGAAAATVAVSAASYYALVHRDGFAKLRALSVRAATALVQLGKPSVPKVALEVLQRTSPVSSWVALCGTVFDVTDEPFFDAQAGVYANWIGHDVTHMLVQMGVALDSADDAAMAQYLDQELSIGLLDAHAGESTRRMALLTEWYARFYSRYDVVAQLADLYAGSAWDAVREQLLPPAVRFGATSSERPRGKCPMGFGSRALNHVISRADPNATDVRTVSFQGKRYDVTNSSLFQDGGEFAHFVGHDITYALATQSNQVSDLDVQPQREYTYAEQVLVERYRIAFARELALLADNDAPSNGPTTPSRNVDLHALLDACENSGSRDDETYRALEAQLTVPNAATKVNQVCARSTMTLLHKAVEKNRLDLVELLVRAGADVAAEAALYDFETPLQMAKRFQHDDIAAFLAAHSNGLE